MGSQTSCMNPNKVHKKKLEEEEKEEQEQRILKEIHEAKTDEDKAIDAVVDKFLANEFVNNKYIPDVIERRMYRNVIKMSIGCMKTTFDNVHVEILGHKLSINIEPVAANQI